MPVNTPKTILVPVDVTPLGETKLAGLAALHREELRKFKQEAIVHLSVFEDL